MREPPVSPVMSALPVSMKRVQDPFLELSSLPQSFSPQSVRFGDCGTASFSIPPGARFLPKGCVNER